MHGRLVVVGGLLAIGLITPSAHVLADPSQPGPGDSWGWTDSAGIGAGARNAADSSGTLPAAAARTGGAPVCTYEALDQTESTIADNMAQDGLGPSAGQGPGTWYRKSCTDVNGMRSAVIVWVAQRTPVDPVALAQQALAYTPMPNPAVGMSPPPGREQLVNLTTFLWIDKAQWQPVSASASAGGVTVTTTATPHRVVWVMGNGDSVTCDEPGVPYDPSRSDADQPDRCRYTYQRSSADQPNGAFTVTATVEWQVTWVATGAAAGAGNLGVVGRSSSFPVRVGEAEATNTSRT